MSEYIIDMQHISKTYPGVSALRDVQLQLREGEVHALVGENGAGKSTLIKLLAGVEAPDAGAEIRIGGELVELRSPMDAIEYGISVIYQDISLFPNMTVAENICVGQRNQRSGLVNWKAINQTARRCLEEFHVEMDVRENLGNIGIAKQQIVAIARAVYSNAKVIIMDEPTASLSSGEIRVLYRIIEKLKNKKISILFVSHKFDEIFTVSDRATILRDGMFVGCDEIQNLTERTLVKMMVGRDVAVVRQQRDIRTDKLLLEVSALHKAGNFTDISFQLFQGEVLGLTGIVGAGRSEVARAIYGVEPADGGDICIEGEKKQIRSAPEGLRQGIAYLPEDRRSQGVIQAQSIRNNITIAALRNLKNRLRLLSPDKEQTLAVEMIQAVDIRPPAPEMLAGKLSGGNQQKVVFGKWLATNPKVLIVDEPTVGVDIGAKTEIHRLLWEMAAQGIGIIMISSDLPEVLAVCSRVLVMARGRITGEFTDMDHVTQEAIMEKALIG
ncbi:MAG: sugar ABC transporter ATP-binding protein [Oscillospiraceae bacterium]|nr:sugar ABC transporter ATP-binding protein [Oscillospiraceae bacterium]